MVSMSSLALADELARESSLCTSLGEELCELVRFAVFLRFVSLAEEGELVPPDALLSNRRDDNIILTLQK